MKQKIVLATGNQGKVREMADVLADFGFEVIAQTDLGIDSPEETGLTFVERRAGLIFRTLCRRRW